MSRQDPFLVGEGKVFPDYHTDWRDRWSSGTGREPLKESAALTNRYYPADKRKRGIDENHR